MNEDIDGQKANPEEMLTDEQRRKESGEDTAENLEQGKDLTETSRKYDCFFVHGIKETIGKQGSGIHNSVVDKEIDWSDQFKILSILHPSIPCSTIRTGSQDMMWSNLGIICNQGEVLPVPSTASTRALSIKKRVPIYENSTEDIDSLVERTINKDQSGANEFVVNNPGIAGIYMGNQGYNSVEFKHHELKELADNLGLPVFIIDQSRIHKTTYIEERRRNDSGAEYSVYRYVKGEEINLEDILGSKTDLPPATKEKIIQQFSENSPFSDDTDWQQYIE